MKVLFVHGALVGDGQHLIYLTSMLPDLGQSHADARAGRGLIRNRTAPPFCALIGCESCLSPTATRTPSPKRSPEPPRSPRWHSGSRCVE